MDTTIRITNHGYGYFRWKIAEERMAWEEIHGTFESAQFWKKALSLINLISMNFHAEECEKELNELVTDYLFDEVKPNEKFPPCKADEMF